MKTKRNTLYKKSYQKMRGHLLLDKKTRECLIFIASGDAKDFKSYPSYKNLNWHSALIKEVNSRE